MSGWTRSRGNSVASSLLAPPDRAAVCIRLLPRARAEAARIKERANAPRRDKISNKIARDFSFGPLVKTPSSPDMVTVGNRACFPGDTEVQGRTEGRRHEDRRS